MHRFAWLVGRWLATAVIVVQVCIIAFSKASELPYRLVLCDQIVDELRRNFNRKFPMRIPVLERFLSIAHYDLVTLTPEDVAVDDEKISATLMTALFYGLREKLRLIFLSQEIRIFLRVRLLTLKL